jgi:LemA protein
MVLPVIIVLAVTSAAAAWCISTSNSVNRLLVKIDESKSGIEIQLKKRYDILTESLNIAKGYAKHEEKLFTELRAVKSGMSVGEINEAAAEQAKAVSGLLALGEAYPEMKSSQMFANLQAQLSEENAQFAASKRAFNANVTKLNNLVVSFPASIVCSIKGQQKMEFIREENVEAMKNVSMAWNGEEKA